MSISATYNFNPTIGSMALAAYRRIQVARTSISAEHMDDAYNESNLLQSNWGADGITFWTVTQVSQPLTQGQATWFVPANAITVLDVYISASGSGNRLIFPFSRTDFASLPNPTQQGAPTVFWHDRTIPSTITLWPVPDGAQTYVMNYYVYTQMQDAVIRQGGNPNLPYFWLDAYVADLAHRLSRIHAPNLEAIRKADRDKAYNDACKQGEIVPIYITPGLSGYYR